MAAAAPVSPIDLLVFREGGSGDHNYVANTWKENYREHFDALLRKDSRAVSLVRSRYFTSRSRIIHGWLALPITKIPLLVLRDEPRMIVAFACVTEVDPGYSILHWLQVQKDWRGKGLAKNLLERIMRPTMAYTHTVAGIRVPDSWTYESEQPPSRKEDLE
jgi:GNAT superfamily N-acetyltransferase